QGRMHIRPVPLQVRVHARERTIHSVLCNFLNSSLSLRVKQVASPLRRRASRAWPNLSFHFVGHFVEKWAELDGVRDKVTDKVDDKAVVSLTFATGSSCL